MAAAGGRPQLGAKPQAAGKSCFKCGKPGHWSRDCTAPREEWIPSTYKAPGAPGAPGGAKAAAPAGAAARQTLIADTFWGDAPDAQPQAANAAAPPPAAKRKAKRPKLTVEDLTGKAGLAAVYATFADELRKTFRGRGHEASDLKRLIELYHGWHRRLFPYVSFEVFIETLERMGSAKPLRSAVHALRSREVYGVRYDDIGRDDAPDDDAAPAPDAGGWASAAARRDLERDAAGGGAADAAQTPHAPRAAAAQDEDEDLMIQEALQQQHEEDEDEDAAALEAMGADAYS